MATTLQTRPAISPEKQIDFIKETKLEEVEKRFKEVAGLEGDLTVFPLTKETHLQVATNKEKSDTFGEVFTPLWLVDEMLELPSKKSFLQAKNTLDLCAGYGQFTIRWMRKLQNERPFFSVDHFLTNHWMNELQIESCHKLLYIFGLSINLAIGDARFLASLPDEAKGLWKHDETKSKWENIKTSTNEFYLNYGTCDFIDFIDIPKQVAK
jgi:hypothetical protein